MPDLSHLDKKYFIDKKIYNCPFCKRNNVSYGIDDEMSFDWSENKECHAFVVRCSSCRKKSLHLTYKPLVSFFKSPYDNKVTYSINNQYKEDIDSHIFYSQPTSFFVIDTRIPDIIRELITEAEGCLKMNFLTGASACMRKALYELLIKEKAEGNNYEQKIKSLKAKNSRIDSVYFDVLFDIQNMTSEKLHEQSWDKWDSEFLKLIIETLKLVLQEIYVSPDERNKNVEQIKKLKSSIRLEKKKI